MKILIFDADQAVRDVFSTMIPEHICVYIEAPVSRDILLQNTDAEAISFFVSSQCRAADIDVLPNLKLIVARSTGIDHIDAEYARGKGIMVTNVAKYGAHTVAEFTFAILLSLTRRVYDGFRRVRDEGKFSTESLEGFDLFGKTIGIVGTGAIGRNVLNIARGFGMQVRMFDVVPDTTLEGSDARYVSLDELLRESDVVSLHVPYTKENHHLLGEAQFKRMKPTAVLVNTARGELIDTEALLRALSSGQIAGACLDVLEEERTLKNEAQLVDGIESISTLKTLIRDHALVDMPRVIITPHIAFYSKEAYREILTVSANNVRSFCAPQSTV